MNNDYNLLYDNFYNTWESINDIALLHTPEQLLLLYDSENTNDEFINMFKNINNIIEHPLKYKYSLIDNNESYDCGICFCHKNDIFKCNICIFKICTSCYNNYHLKYNINKCSHCRN